MGNVSIHGEIRHYDNRIDKVLKCDDNELYITTNGRRMLFGRCDAEIIVYREYTEKFIAGAVSRVGWSHIVLTLGENIECVKGQGIDTLEEASMMEEWECEVVDHATKKRLINFE